MELTLISSNMFLLPQPISVDNKKRIHLFTKTCLEYHVDFIFLQEVWLNNYVNLIKKQLGNYYFIGKPDLLYNKTGLLIFSKYKPLNFKKCSFGLDSRSAFYDSLGQKGYLYAQYEIENKMIDILNLHLNCAYKGKQKNARETQLKTIENLIDKNKNSLIVAGDFNESCDILLKNACPSNDLSPGIKSFSLDNSYRNRGFHKFTKRFLKSDIETSDQDIDHVMFFPKQLTGSITKKFILNPLVSDHYPIFARIKC